MRLPKFSAPRGQALTETAIALPLFLMGLFGVIWAIREGAMSERVQMSVRYGGVVGSMDNPYQDYSLYAMYATIDGLPPTNYATCAPNTTAGMPGIVINTRKGFFQPATVPAPTCYGGLTDVDGPETYQEPILLQDNAAFITSPNATGGFMANVLGSSTTSNSAVQNFFKSPDLETLTECTQVGIAFDESAEGFGDTVSPTTPPSPFPTTLIPVSPVATGGSLPCVAYTPGLGVSTPTPTPSPTPTPTPTPSPSPTPTPTHDADRRRPRRLRPTRRRRRRARP